MKGTVLVTGASGFIGRSLVAALAREGYAVRAAARDPQSVGVHAGVAPVKLPDLAARVDWSGLLEGATHVVHLAGLAHSPGVLADDSLYDLDRVRSLLHLGRNRFTSTCAQSVEPTLELGRKKAR